MTPLYVIDRVTGQRVHEQVYGGQALHLLYGSHRLARIVGRPLSRLASHFSLFSALYGWWQKRSWSARKIEPFIQAYGVDSSEFLHPVASFRSFNDFFIRELKPTSRPINSDPSVAVIPADGRYFFYPEFAQGQLIDVKGRRLDLPTLLGDAELAKRYAGGSVVMARLCPSDYHRFHFPIDCIPSASRLINGTLYSVNPIAIRQNLRIFSENKRCISLLRSSLFGNVVCIEVGATNVGSIHETYIPEQPVVKGQEKGYFSFGGSAMLLFFQPGKIQFDADLIAATQAGIEIRCLLGQSLGTAQLPQHINKR